MLGLLGVLGWGGWVLTWVGFAGTDAGCDGGGNAEVS